MTRRVVYISSITSGSKFRLVANRTAAAAETRTQGTRWASCAINDNGGNFNRPFKHEQLFPEAGYKMGTKIIAGIFSWIRVYPPKFNVFNLPCPARYKKTFQQRSK